MGLYVLLNVNTYTTLVRTQNLLITIHLDQSIYLASYEMVLNYVMTFVSLSKLNLSHFTEPVRQVLADLHPKHVVQCANKICSKSNSSCAQYVTSDNKIGWKKVETCKFGSAKWFLPFSFTQFVEAGKGHDKTSHIPKKSVINMTWLVLVGCY